MRKYAIAAVVGVLMVVGFYFSSPARYLASDAPESLKMEYVQIKTEMIQALQWQDQGEFVQFDVETTDPEFCQKWSQVSVTLAADGIGVSGDAPGAQATALCQAGRFEMRWPKQISHWRGSIQKTGDYIQIPEKFYVSSVVLDGPMGHMSISSFEISAIRNQLFELIALQ